MFGKNVGNTPKGAIIINGKQVADTYVCVHCGMHFRKTFDAGRGKWLNPGGHADSICLKCYGPTCGKEKCNVCIPFEAKIEYHEATGGNKLAQILKIKSKYPDIDRFGI